MAVDSAPVLKTRDLGRRFRVGASTVDALSGVNIAIDPGAFVAVTGPSGSGKSTLLALLDLLDSPSSGDYWLEGRQVSGLDRDARAQIRNRRIGYVFQAFNLLARNTAVENVELPLIYAGAPRPERRQRALDALAVVGLTNRAGHRPGELSGGEQQRVAIARAIVHEPAVILADEPTGALDRGTGDTVLEILGELNSAGRTIVMVTHDDHIAGYAQRRIAMEDGRIVAHDPVVAVARGVPG